jgi:ACS family allantoate permease-like MFS transporter
VVDLLRFLQNLIGPQTFQEDQAPKYTSGVVAMLTCYCASIVLIGVYGIVVVRSNKQKREAIDARGRETEGKEDLLDEWHDQTDFEVNRSLSR